MVKKIIAAAAGLGAAGLMLYLASRAAAKIGTRMVVTVAPPEKVLASEEFPFTGYLEDVRGNKLEGKNVKVYIDGVERGSDYTKADGRWSWGLLPNREGTFEIYAAFPGDEQYAGCGLRW